MGVKIRAKVKIRVVGSPPSWDFFRMCLEPQSGVGRNDDDDQKYDDQPFKHDDDQQTSAVGLNEEMAR